MRASTQVLAARLAEPAGNGVQVYKYAKRPMPSRLSPSLYHFKAVNKFPLLYGNVMMSKFNVGLRDFDQPSGYDDDHVPHIDSRDRMETTGNLKWTEWDKTLNPQLYNNTAEATPTPEYVGKRSGILNPILGWVKMGGTKKWQKLRDNARRKKYLLYGKWVEGSSSTPVFLRVPKIGAHGPNHRWEGKLVYTEVKLSAIIWAMDAGMLNRNEVITLHALRAANLIHEFELVWPGVCIVPGDVTELKYPIHLELQRARPEVISMIENAGGSFVASYLSPEGLYQELHPEQFPVFADQYLPDNHSFSNVHSLPSERGYLAQWYEDKGKYAHPGAGRRLSHYVKPPHQRDFPATFEEYERVKHFQKFHFDMPGTGTELPWFTEQTSDFIRRRFGKPSPV